VGFAFRGLVVHANGDEELVLARRQFSGDPRPLARLLGSEPPLLEPERSEVDALARRGSPCSSASSKFGGMSVR
jgi:hypothetical protein